MAISRIILPEGFQTTTTTESPEALTLKHVLMCVLQFVRNEADHHSRSSRSPVIPLDVQDNNNANSFAVRCVKSLLYK